MLPRSFKPAKCKTALNLAKSRIKLLKNKKEIQIKQMRRELAQLLQSGQDQTARIRVEHVAREEKMMVAYELIEIYCELIVARMPIIESQKNCPPDLKEAITSLIFAAQRCGDIPELQDISKNFNAKYGKDFAAAAIELRPQCGVCRTLVEKLSVKAPDAQMKLKILNAIAEEHDVEWKPKELEYEDPVPSIDMSGVALGDKVNRIQMESLDFLIPNNLHQHAHANIRSDSSSRSHAHPKINDSGFPPMATSHPSAIIPERSSQSLNQSSGAAQNSFPMSRENWKPELLNSTAAQSANESAERASAAARAAAELAQHSSIMNVDSSGSLAPCVHDQNECKGVHNDPVGQQKHVELNSASISDNQRSPGVWGSRLGNKQGNSAECVEPKREDNTKSRAQCESKRENYRESNNCSDSEAEFNVFASSDNQQYEDKPADNPFHKETLEVKDQSSCSQFQLSALGDEYGVFSNLNENYRIGSGYGYFDSFNHAAATANDNDWLVKASCLSEFSHGKQEIPFKDQGESDPILESSDVDVGTSHRDNQIDTGDRGTHGDIALVFDESGSDDEFPFAPMENSYDLPPFIIYSQKHSSFHQEHSTENLPKQSFASLPVRFDSHRASSGSEKGPENKKTSPDDVHLKLKRETTGSPEPPRRDEDAAFRPSPQTEMSKDCQCLCSSLAEKPMTAKRFPIQEPSNLRKQDASGADISKTPSHVHPKLPDFEALTAHMKSLRRNGQ